MRPVRSLRKQLGFIEFLPLIATVASALVGSSSQRSANQQNAQMAADSTQFNAEQAELNRTFSAQQAAQQMDFQREMSNTSYQRAVGDMQAAGLNPMLAYSQGGSSTPGGAAGAGSSAQAVTSRSEAEYRHTDFLTQSLTAAQIDKVQAETEETRARTETERERPREVRERAGVSQQQQVKLEAEVSHIADQIQLTQAQREKVKQETRNLAEDQGIKAAEMMLKRFELLVREAQTPAEINEAVAQAKAWGSKYGQEVRPYVGDAVKGVGSAADIVRSFRGRRP